MSEFGHMRVLAVDDNPADLERLKQILEGEGYGSVLASEDPEAVAELSAAWKPDAVLLDLDMAAAGAQRVLSAMRELTLEPESLPVLAIADPGEAEARERALALGVRDFITRPIDATELVVRLRNALHSRHLQRRLDASRRALEQAVRERTMDLEQARLESLTILASVAEYHDDDTHHHTQRVGLLSARIAEALELPDHFVAAIRDAAPLHDLGKVAIPQAIVLKPGTLTAYEREHMMRHVEFGAEMLASARSTVLALAAEIARTHHERWDGTGYLDGLAGEDIPLSGRVVAVADAFDALTHERPYKAAWDTGRALDDMRAKAGRQFDPRVIDAFMTVDVQALGQEIHGLDERSAA